MAKAKKAAKVDFYGEHGAILAVEEKVAEELGAYGQFRQSFYGNFRRGVLVQVTRGRKVAPGTVGTLIWIGQSDFGLRVGIKLASGEVAWTSLSNIEADGPTGNSLAYIEGPVPEPKAA